LIQSEPFEELVYLFNTASLDRLGTAVHLVQQVDFSWAAMAHEVGTVSGDDDLSL
jgi:hypothetical protein